MTDRFGNQRTQENIRMDGMAMLDFVATKVPEQIHSLCERNEVKLSDIDHFFFHQASRKAIDSLGELLKIPRDKIFETLSEVGNTVSASIPVNLRLAMDRGVLLPGQNIIVSGFGVGLSWASALIRT